MPTRIRWLAPLLALAGASAHAAEGGYFATFTLDGAHVREASLMAMPAYEAPRGTPVHDGWSLRVLDAAGAELAAVPVGDPLRRTTHAPREGALAARVPALAAAATLELVDASGRVAWQGPLDAATREAARAKADEIGAQLAASMPADAKRASSPELPRLEAFRNAGGLSAAVAALGTTSTPEARDAADAALRRFGDRRRAQLAAHTAPAAKATTQVNALRELSGIVRSAGGEAIADVTVRATRADSGAYVLSTRTDADGRYEMKIADGTYLLEIDSGARESLGVDNRLYVGARFDTPVTVAGNVVRDLALPVAERTLTLVVNWDVRITSTAEVRVRRDGTTLARPRLGRWDSAGCTATACTATWTLRITPGTYDFDVEIVTAGVATRTVAQVDLASSNRRIDVDVAASPPAWDGRLQKVDGTPYADAPVFVFDALGRYRAAVSSGSDGRFSVPAGDGWTVEFSASATDRGIGKRVVLGAVAGAPPVVTLDDPGIAVSGTGSPVRLFTGASSDRVRLLYLSEGYTATPEAFTDGNGNGMWDGILWYDTNGNGRYEAANDFVDVYGNAALPAEGSVPNTTANEAFADTSGDGFPNFDDRALFLRNARDHLRGLFGTDYWDRNAHRFQADAAFVASPQSGMTVTAEDGTVVKRANTLFNARMSMERQIIELDRTRAMQMAQQLLPGFDELVVLVNLPVVAGRATQTVGANPGSMVTRGGYHGVDLDDPVAGHEMGHFIGDLGDEYEELFTTIDPADHYPSANVTLSIDRATVPWGALLSPGDLPMRVPQEGIGLFEGADYVQGGAYRPSWNSMMRYGVLFNAPSRTALDAGFGRFVTPLPPAPTPGNWYDRRRSGHGFDLQLVRRDATAGDVYYAVFYTYDALGVPEWYVALANWRDGKLVPGADANGNTLTRIRYDATRPPGQRVVPDATVPGQIEFDFAQVDACRTPDRAGAPALARVTWRIRAETATWCIEPLVLTEGYRAGRNLSGHWSSPGDGGWGFEAVTTPNADPSQPPGLIVYLYYPTADGNIRWATASTPSYVPGQGLPLLEITSGYCRTCVSPPSTGVRTIGTLTPNLGAALRESPASATNRVTIRIDGGGDVRFERSDAPVTLLSQPPGT